jgi:BirA family transcriptional regulator, biotin operon repressor / biotin---[acetyl-CoA-carboxylase] ligase
MSCAVKNGTLEFENNSCEERRELMRIITLESAASTNSYLLEHAGLLAENYLAVRAVIQTAGRGRHGRTWFSGLGKDLSFSFVYHPLAGANSAWVTVLSGLALYRVIEPLAGKSLSIKWPNDLYANGKKISGILVEQTQIRGKNVCVIGIGLNLNSMGSELSPEAVSLRECTGHDHDIDAIMHDILKSAHDLLEGVSFPLQDRIVSEFTRASSSLGRKVRFTDDQGIREGIITGVSRSCALILSCGGREHEYTGEVEFLA